LFALASTSSAQDKPSFCSGFSTPQDIVQCALERHPDVLRAQAQLSQGQMLESVAAQRPNPELDSKSTFGKSEGDPVANIELNLAHTFELGGKRGARIERAVADRDRISISLQRAREEVYFSTLLSLYRYRQLHDENRILDEALATFARILSHYKSRPNLGPEQQVSQRVFELAQADSQLKKSANQAELEVIRRRIGLAVGQNIALSAALLPPKKVDWPSFSSRPASTLAGSDVKAAQAELKLAETEVSLAQSQSWPDLKLGPSFNRQTQAGVSYNAFGFNLSVPLPLYQSNGAGRAYAERGVAAAEQSLRLVETQLNTEKETLLLQYDFFVKALKASVTLSEIEKKHQSIDALFSRGLIASSLVIESHRQIIEFTKTQNEQELQAVEALARIYRLEGKLLEEKL
jgi:cobalt-zinc-cadmium efflux system outer membrane protein